MGDLSLSELSCNRLTPGRRRSQILSSIPLNYMKMVQSSKPTTLTTRLLAGELSTEWRFSNFRLGGEGPICEKFSILSSFLTNNQIKIFYSKFHQNWIINQDFEKILRGGWDTNPHFFRKLSSLTVFNSIKEVSTFWGKKQVSYFWLLFKTYLQVLIIRTCRQDLKSIEKRETCFEACHNLFASHWCFSKNRRPKTPFCSKFKNFHEKS